MPMEATPAEQFVVAVATKWAGELTVLLLAGEVTKTPVPDLTVMLTWWSKLRRSCPTPRPPRRNCRD